MDKQEEQSEMYKVVLVGDAGVGKTFLMTRYVKNLLPKNSVPTIGIEFAGKNVVLKNGKQVKAQIWDTAGQERYRSITSNHFKKACGALIVYDVTKESSFESVVKWIEDLRQVADQDAVIILVGNKIDITETDPAARKVSQADGRNLAAQQKALFQETSAVTGSNVNNCFEMLLNEIYNIKSPRPDNGGNVNIFKPGQPDVNQPSQCSC